MNRIINLIIAVLYSGLLMAKVTLPPYWSDNMVLQQLSKIKIKGQTTNPTQNIEIRFSWNNEYHTIASDSKGKWELNMETPCAGGPYEINIFDGDSLNINDIYIGEVWLCAGQSNMAMPVKGFLGQPVLSSTETIINSDRNIPIRMFTVQRNYSKLPIENYQGEWKVCSPENVPEFSATAYFFALQLYHTLKIPIGLVHASRGSSYIQSWMSKEALIPIKDISFKHLDENESAQVNAPHKKACMIYNAMLYPLKDLSLKGIIWYQGESNRYNASQYRQLLPKFVEDIRALFNKNLPVYYAQIAPVPNTAPTEPPTGALLREAQRLCELSIPNVGMAVLIDVGDNEWVHPTDKPTVGKRLAYLALEKTYKIPNFIGSSPRIQSLSIAQGKALLSFENADLGITTYGKELTLFELAGTDGQYYPAKAKIIDRQKVEVWHEKVHKPTSVRYAFRNFVIGELYGVNGLPVSSFCITEDHK